jgi:hypothetical protein
MERPERPIHNCKFAFECPRQWFQFAETGDWKVRYCDECEQPVYLAETQADLDLNIAYGRCTAIYDPILDAYGTAGAIAPEEYRGNYSTIVLLPVSNLSVEQLKGLKDLMSWTGNLIQLRRTITDGAEHVLVADEYDPVVERMSARLRELSIGFRRESRTNRP